MTARVVAVAALLIAATFLPGAAWTQTFSQRGFVDGSGEWFPNTVPNDQTTLIGDLLLREELFVRAASWLQIAGGMDLRANSHDEVEDQWRVDFSDRTVLRPRISVRRLAATITHRKITVDVGKQFIRWGQADIVNPTDRFAPRDFLHVVDTEVLAVTGVRAVVQAGDHGTVEGVWLPRFTPSRMPLLDQRWTVRPAGGGILPLVDGGAEFPGRWQAGVRWNHSGTFEYSLSFFDGFNHEPNIKPVLEAEGQVEGVAISSGAAAGLGQISPAGSPIVEVTRTYPAIRTYGADAALPTSWFTVKGEMAYFTSEAPMTDEYVLYVVQLERPHGEWMFAGGYAGEVLTARRGQLGFAPDRGLTRSVIARALYNIDAERSFALETDIRQNLEGAYLKAEYSQAFGQHWRATAAGAIIRGEPDDFLGQYHRNSYVSLAARCSF